MWTLTRAAVGERREGGVAQVDFYEHASSFIHVVLFQPSGAHRRGGPCSWLRSSAVEIFQG